MNIIYSILLEFGPCSSLEMLDFLRSDLYYQKGYISSEEWTHSKIQYQLKKISRNNKDIFKFLCDDGFKIRYGTTKFQYYLLQEPRFLKVKGYLKRCMFCGMPIYINESKVFHFKYKCNQYQEQKYFKLVKIDYFWTIISRDFVYGILDDLKSCSLRLPGKNKSKTKDNFLSELWLINETLREKEIIEFDRLLTLKAEEYIA